MSRDFAGAWLPLAWRGLLSACCCCEGTQTWVDAWGEAAEGRGVHSQRELVRLTQTWRAPLAPSLRACARPGNEHARSQSLTWNWEKEGCAVQAALLRVWETWAMVRAWWLLPTEGRGRGW